MSKFTHFCLYERQRIEKYLRQGKTRQYIADKLDRGKSSIVDEINRNLVNGKYIATKADHKAYVARRNSKTQCLKVSMNLELREFVETSIADDQTPQGISGRLREIEKDIEYASAKAIYKFIYSPLGRNLEKHLYSKAVKKYGGPKRGKPAAIDGRVSIEERPKVVDNRLQFGHFEGDFIESGKDGHGSLLVLVERKTRYPFLHYLEKRDTATVNRVVDELLGDVSVRSLTIDNDISFQKHVELSELIEAAIFFCHPQAPHEKGTVENRNKAIRRYIKKRSDLSKYTASDFKDTEYKLRNRFMKCLGYRTPQETWNREVKKQKSHAVVVSLQEKILI
jgi:IS30 family transposase